MRMSRFDTAFLYKSAQRLCEWHFSGRGRQKGGIERAVAVEVVQGF